MKISTIVPTLPKLSLVRFCHIGIVNLLPVGIEFTHEVSAFLSTICGLKGAVETFRKWLPRAIHSCGQQGSSSVPFRMQDEKNKLGLVFKILAFIIAIPVYGCMAIFMIAVPLLFIGGLWMLLSGQVDTPEELWGFIFVVPIAGFFSKEIYEDIYYKYIRKND